MINPYLTGWDVYWHYHRIEDLVNLGKLSPASGHYYYYPFFHLINAIISLLISPDITILLFVNLVIGTFTVILMYYITNALSNSRTALAGALITSVSTLHIYRSTGLARPDVTFILFGILAIIKASHYGVSCSWVIFWLAAVAVFFIHPTATVALLTFLGANFILKNIRAYFKEKFYTFKITPFVSYLIGFIAYLEFVHYSLFVDIVKIIFIPEEEVAPLVTILPPEMAEKVSWIYHAEAYVSYLGISLILLLGVIGSLKWLLKYDLNKLTILLGIVFIYLIPIYSVLTNFFETQPSRFLVHGDILTIIPAAVGMGTLFEIVKRKYWKISLAIAFLFVFCFFSVTSYLTGDDNCIFNKELPFDQRHATQSALVIYPYIDKISGPFYVDEEITRYLFSGDRGIVRAIRKDIRGLNIHISEEERGFFIINLNKLEKGFIWKVKFKKSFLDNFKKDEKIYDNGNVVIFKR
jgi:asparagine N-glycosylation enzyme membrane subunit Stt3